MNILILNASPRRDGTVSRLVAAIAEGAQERHSVRSIFLPDLNIRDCASCGRCIELGHCAVRDDIAIVEEAILAADLIVLASPTHWSGVSAHMLRVFERLVGFLIDKREFPPAPRCAKGRQALLVTACGAPWPFNVIGRQSRGCIWQMKRVCRSAGIEVIGSFVLAGSRRKGGVPEKLFDKARALGGTL
ncbi:MAG: flavodoxin family protein [Opitutales bacterium]|jgi:multimeric flavodoxin WrbA